MKHDPLLAIGMSVPESARLYGMVLIGLVLLIFLALGLVLFLISREGQKEAEEMRKLVRHMRKLRERHEATASPTRRKGTKVKRGKG